MFHLDHPFTYRVPESMRATGPGAGGIGLGSRVKVPFGGRRRVDGYVIGTTEHVPPDAKDVLRLVSPVPAFGPAELELARWLAARYAGTLVDALRLVLPARVAAVDKQPPGPPAPRARAAGPRPAEDPLAALADGRSGDVVWWRPAPGEDRGARVAALVETVLAQGRGAIVLVPEVLTSSSVADAVRHRFPEAADLGAVSDRRRYRQWREIAAGHRRVVIGGRSAVFAPMTDLGLIVVEEEASFGYKEQRSPRYCAREVAVWRSRQAGALCVLSGIVPSAALVAMVGSGFARALEPDRTTERRQAPLVEVVDPDDEGPAGTRVHPRGLQVVRAALGRGEPAFVLVPRRGEADPDARGARTAGQVAGELQRLLPGAPVVRLDRELVPAGAPPVAKGAAVVVGTIAGVKESPPLPGCRTVLVLAADAALGQPEVAAAEEAYRIWSRAALWCGPRQAGGRMVLQARDGAHHAVQALARWDPGFFWRHELARRRAAGFPPAWQLVLLEGPDPDEAPAVAAAVGGALGRGASLLGPAILGSGWRIIATVPDSAEAARALRPLQIEASRRGTPRFIVDVDPLEVLGDGRPSRAARDRRERE